jgi:hypothetical protein
VGDDPAPVAKLAQVRIVAQQPYFGVVGVTLSAGALTAGAETGKRVVDFHAVGAVSALSGINWADGLGWAGVANPVDLGLSGFAG